MMNPADVQVLLCDLQPSIVSRSRTNPADAMARSAGVLAEVAKVLAIPMRSGVVPDGGKPPVPIPERADHAADATTFPRMSASPGFLEV